MEHTVEVKLTLVVRILNESNFDDFDTSEKARLLVQDMIDMSAWPLEGLDAEVTEATVRVLESSK